VHNAAESLTLKVLLRKTKEFATATGSHYRSLFAVLSEGFRDIG